MTRAEALRDRIVARIETAGFGALGLHVLADADEAQHRWAPDARIDVQSVAKGVCVIAAGIAADEGLVDIDAPVAELLPSWQTGAGTDRVTLRHLLSMSSGIDLPWSETMMTDWPDLAAEFLSRPTTERRFQYSNASTYTAMTALAERTGDPVSYLRPRLFEPLGIPDVQWERCPNGRILAGGGLMLRTAEMAAIGRLIRDRGAWEGRRVVSSEWIDAMHDDWVPAGTSPAYDRYALGGWAGPGAAWRLHGAHGQLLLFVDDVVVTITAHDHFGADAVAATVVGMISD